LGVLRPTLGGLACTTAAKHNYNAGNQEFNMRIQQLGSTTIKLTSALALCLGLAACGGGSSGSALDDYNGNGGGGDGDGDTSNELAQIGTGSGADFRPGEINVGIGDSELSAGGNTLLSVNVVNNGSLITDSVQVTFSSTCFANGEALFEPQAGLTCDADCPTNIVDTSNGQATIRYIANGCLGTDNIKATTTYGGSVISANGTVSIASDTVTSLSFIDASPSVITLKGSGGEETSALRFRVRGSTGAPIKDVGVDFSLSRTSGGLKLVNESSTSDVDGYVYTTVQSGSVPGPVQVTATTTETGISTQSSSLVLSTGLPDQNSFSMSASRLAPNSWNIDGVESEIIIRTADAFNNPAPIGTPIYFTTNGGAIEGECFIQPEEDSPNKSSGACSATWRSQDPKPETDEVTPGSPFPFLVDEENLTLICPNGQLAGHGSECRHGRLKVVATTLGNESFIDTNGNGLYDHEEDEFYTSTSPEGNTTKRAQNCLRNEPISGLASRPVSSGTSDARGCDDIGDPYIDHNFNGKYDKDEEIATIDDKFDASYTPANGLYNGLLCRQEDVDAGNCSREPVLVRADTTLVMSSYNLLRMPDGGLPGQPDEIVLGPNETVAFTMMVADQNGNGIPYGSSTEAYDETAFEMEVVVSPEGDWPESQEYGYVTVFVTSSDEPPSGAVGVSISRPSGDGEDNEGGITSTFLIPVRAEGFEVEE
jgi:hypothetical protein